MSDERLKFDKYDKWLRDTHHFTGVRVGETNYKYVTNTLKADFEASKFWKELTGNLIEYNDEYLVKNGYSLFVQLEPNVQIKPFDSFLLKTYRENVLDNRNWPSEPEGGWLTPSNWYSRIDDVIRTLFIVKYLDGVQFFVDKLERLSQRLAVDCTVDLEAKEEGYYAAHCYTTHSFNIPTLTWETERVDVRVEIQITTQLQEVIRKLLHKYYEINRSKPRVDVKKWQWDYECEEFCANYLGHILHYVEGMIVGVRQKQKEGP